LERRSEELVATDPAEEAAFHESILMAEREHKSDLAQEHVQERELEMRIQAKGYLIDQAQHRLDALGTNDQEVIWQARKEIVELMGEQEIPPIILVEFW